MKYLKIDIIINFYIYMVVWIILILFFKIFENSHLMYKQNFNVSIIL